VADHKSVKNDPNPFPLGSGPEVDTSPELSAKEVLYYQILIDITR
jgi:hypothetical protein